MAADGPYIIVDTEQPTPLDQTAKAEPADTERPKAHQPPFGIVDRVTISSEAYKKSRQYRAENETDKNAPVTKNSILLPFSPGKSSDHA
jgi:hypothetical protein